MTCRAFALIVLIASAFVSSLSAEPAMEEWVDRAGRTLTASLEALDGDTAVLKDPKGKTYRVPLSQLSPASREKAESLAGDEEERDQPGAPKRKPVFVHRAPGYELRLYGGRRWGEFDVLVDGQPTEAGPVQLTFDAARVDQGMRTGFKFLQLQGTPVRSGNRVTWKGDLEEGKELTLEVELLQDGIAVQYFYDDEGLDRRKRPHAIKATFPTLMEIVPGTEVYQGVLSREGVRRSQLKSLFEGYALDVELYEKEGEELTFTEPNKKGFMAPLEQLTVEGMYGDRVVIVEGPEEDAEASFYIYKMRPAFDGFVVAFRKEDGRSKKKRELVLRVQQGR